MIETNLFIRYLQLHPKPLYIAICRLVVNPVSTNATEIISFRKTKVKWY